MITSQIGLDLIKHFEGLHDGDLKEIGLQPKKDPVGIYTEGWGRAMRDKKGNFIKDKLTAYKNITIKTMEQANTALKVDIVPFELQVLRKVKRSLKQNEFDALVVHTYNTGGSSTLFKLVSENASEESIKKWWTTKYITGQGNPKPLSGLVRRRNAEFKLFSIK